MRVKRFFVISSYCSRVRTPQQKDVRTTRAAGLDAADIREEAEQTAENGAAQEAAVAQAVQGALAEAKEEDIVLAFGSLSYLHQVKAAYGDGMPEKRDER